MGLETGNPIPQGIRIDEEYVKQANG